MKTSSDSVWQLKEVSSYETPKSQVFYGEKGRTRTAQKMQSCSTPNNTLNQGFPNILYSYTAVICSSNSLAHALDDKSLGISPSILPLFTGACQKRQPSFKQKCHCHQDPPTCSPSRADLASVSPRRQKGEWRSCSSFTPSDLWVWLLPGGQRSVVAG